MTSATLAQTTARGTRPARPITLYRYPASGHCHRVQLFLSLLDLPVHLVDVDITKREHKQPAFLKLNPFGQIPVIEDDGVVLADANAILVYLARRYDNSNWLPQEPVEAAKVQRWLSVAAGPLAFGPAAARLVKLFNAPFNFDEVSRRALDLFALMASQLQESAFLTGAEPTLADIANYSYVALAPQGGLSLDDFPALGAWLARLEAMPRFLPITRT